MTSLHPLTVAATSQPIRTADLDRQIDGLVRESLDHPAVHHPYLKSFAQVDFMDPVRVLQQYAHEYSGYAAWFPNYLRMVIRRLDRKDHRLLLLKNLEEEKGQLDQEECDELRGVGIDPESVLGIPHPVLFRRFCHAIGVTDETLARPTAAAKKWRGMFLEFLSTATPAEAVGALGLGTEHIVKPVYQQLLQGIRRCGALQREDYVFFELHCLVDDQHQQDLLAIAKDLAREPGGLAELRNGMLKALELRCEFWDRIYFKLDGARNTMPQKARIA